MTLARLLILLSLCSCLSEEPEMIIYRIPQNEHYSVPLQVRSMDHEPLVFWAKFDSSAAYDNGSADINKLYGFTDCNDSVHENSARFGWRWHDNNLEVFSYVYCNGEVSWQLLGTAELNKWQKYEIGMQSGKYSFKFDNKQITTQRCNHCNTGLYFLLKPYFGGNIPAPHDVYISIKQFN